MTTQPPQPPDPWGQQPQQPYQQSPPYQQPRPGPPARKKRRTGLIILGILVGCGILFTGCLAALLSGSPDTSGGGGEQQAADQPTATKQPAVPAGKAKTVLTDSGSGAGRTKKFTVTGEFEIRWTWKGEQLQGTDVGVFSATLGGDTTGDLVANTTESGSDTYNGDTGVQGTATYYLEINAANGKWTVKVVDTPN